MIDDPQSFLENFRGSTIILDEVHRLNNPSEVLKIAADHFPDVKVLATGSSTLGASAKFKDTLLGRKYEIWLTPLILDDMRDFGLRDIKNRLLRGGLPLFFLSEKLPEKEYQEWMDAFWAKDIQELFRLERRHSFLRFSELLMTQSGGIFEATRFATPCEVSRTTISNYLAMLEATFVVHVIRPFSTKKSSEILSAPKVYGFDTGFVSYYRGWHELRNDDLGILWEHLVLNEIHAQTQSRNVFYWRDKRGHEIDFVWSFNNSTPIAIECKWSVTDFDPTNLKAFRRHYPQGLNLVVASDVQRTYSKRYGDIKVVFISLEGLIKELLDLKGRQTRHT